MGQPQPEQQVPLLDRVKKYDFGQSRLALTEMSGKIGGAYGKADEMKALEKDLVGILEATDATYAAKQYACRELSIVGTATAAPALAKLLATKDCDDMARFALERMPGEAVDQVLLEALPKAGGNVKIGIVNTLGQRQTVKAVPAIRELVSSSDAPTAGAAISALGKIGGDEACKVLMEAKEKAAGPQKRLAFDACLKCAEKFVAQGQSVKALAIYKELSKDGAPQLVRTAAMKGMVGAAGVRP